MQKHHLWHCTPKTINKIFFHAIKTKTQWAVAGKWRSQWILAAIFLNIPHIFTIYFYWLDGVGGYGMILLAPCEKNASILQLAAMLRGGDFFTQKQSLITLKNVTPIQECRQKLARTDQPHGQGTNRRTNSLMDRQRD